MHRIHSRSILIYDRQVSPLNGGICFSHYSILQRSHRTPSAPPPLLSPPPLRLEEEGGGKRGRRRKEVGEGRRVESLSLSLFSTHARTTNVLSHCLEKCVFSLLPTGSTPPPPLSLRPHVLRGRTGRPDRRYRSAGQGCQGNLTSILFLLVCQKTLSLKAFLRLSLFFHHRTSARSMDQTAADAKKRRNKEEDSSSSSDPSHTTGRGRGFPSSSSPRSRIHSLRGCFCCCCCCRCSLLKQYPLAGSGSHIKERGVFYCR